ncbi:uncharacterized protein LOC128880108 isoform X2 [Hylaeus volcanicus]|nr:uncharacterized protein LOC128880108 isoform X2 [Hylaeus volcanicus]
MEGPSTPLPKPICHIAYNQTDVEVNTAASETTTAQEAQEKKTQCGSKIEETPNVEDASNEGEISTKPSEMTEESTGATVQVTEESSSNQEASEVNQETPETNYATPEANYESPEDVHVLQETNEEVPEENQEWSSTSIDTRTSTITETNAETTIESIDETKQKKEPTVDTVVQEVYEIIKPTPSMFLDEDVPLESKSVTGVILEKTEDAEDEDDENRFTRLGEKVTQVPRPSLTSYLRRSKVPPSGTLQHLASLYDSLSKDARKQGFGKYTGYSDEVLNVLMTSAEGGVAPQLKKILDKVLERNELTRDDAKLKTNQTIRDLNNPSSTLNKDLRPVLPLRYSP